MEFKSVSINNCYILQDEVFSNQFYTYINAKAVYSASIFHLAFFKGDISLINEDVLKKYQKFNNDLYLLNSPNLYIPFEVNFHENSLYQAYYESDHFPLSLWIEEKSLIPFNIFIQIMEDTLYGLRILEKAGHSHLFLTPEEILVPLNLNLNKHVKLDNIGLNSIIHSLFNTKEIENYRKKYYRKGTKSVEKMLLKNISEDIFSFGNIINQIIPLCIFDNENNKILIQDKINQLINKPDSISSIDEVIDLFVNFFETTRPHLLPDQQFNYKYTGQASFDIPDYDDWQEEAVLEPYNEDEDPIENIDKKTLYKQNITFLKSIASVFSKLFFKRKKIVNVSATLNEYANHPNEINIKEKTSPKKQEYKSKTDTNLKTYESSGLDKDLIRKNTNNILNEIENHYTKSSENNFDRKSSTQKKDDIAVSSTQIFNNKSNTDIKKNIKTSNDKISSLKVDGSMNYDKQELVSIFDNSLLKRDYTRSYDIIKESISRERKSNQKIETNELQNILNAKLKQLDAHFSINESTNILGKLAKLESMQPMEVTELNKDIVLDLRNKLGKESNEPISNEEFSVKNLNIFHKFLKYLKIQFKILLRK